MCNCCKTWSLVLPLPVQALHFLLGFTRCCGEVQRGLLLLIFCIDVRSIIHQTLWKVYIQSQLISSIIWYCVESLRSRWSQKWISSTSTDRKNSETNAWKLEPRSEWIQSFSWSTVTWGYSYIAWVVVGCTLSFTCPHFVTVTHLVLPCIAAKWSGHRSSSFLGAISPPCLRITWRNAM